MRLDRYIANNSSFSRGDVGKLVKTRRVTINGLYPERKDSHIDPVADVVSIDGSALVRAQHCYLMLHKPAGYVCANSDSDHPTVLDLLDSYPTSASQKLQIVGRLDLDTTGLLLLTTDGDWNHAICSPRSHCAKTYLVNLASPFDAQSIAAFRQGIQLKGENKLTQPAEINIINDHRVSLTIREGKYHQVKRMFAATGNRVTALQRVKIGQIELDPALKAGEYRSLTEDEVKLP